MKWTLLSTLIALLLSCHSPVGAQSVKPKFSLPDSPCGNPAVSSDFYLTPDEYENALVTKVVDGNTVVVTFGNGKRKRIKLGGVEAPHPKTEAGQLSQSYLSALVLNKRIQILVYGSNFKDKVVGGRISVESVPSDINLSMLESGMGRYGLAKHLAGSVFGANVAYKSSDLVSEDQDAISDAEEWFTSQLQVRLDYLRILATQDVPINRLEIADLADEIAQRRASSEVPNVNPAAQHVVGPERG